jgi:hypothetical protein
MSEQVYITLLSISGTVLLLALGLIGYFFKRIVKSLDNFDTTLKGFSVDYSATKERVKQMQLGCKERHDTINSRLTEHGKRLDTAEKNIGRLEVIVNP